MENILGDVSFERAVKVADDGYHIGFIVILVMLIVATLTLLIIGISYSLLCGRTPKRTRLVESELQSTQM